MRELKIFTQREGGIEHVSADNMEPARSYIADSVGKAIQRNVKALMRQCPNHP